MQESASVNGAPPVPVAPTNGQPWAATPALLFTPERLQELVTHWRSHLMWPTSSGG